MKQIKDYTHYIFDLDQTIMTLNIDWTVWLQVVEDIFSERHIRFAFTSSKAAFIQLNDLVRAEGEATRQEINHKIRDAEMNHLDGYTLVPQCISFLTSLPPSAHRYIWTSNALDTANKALVDTDLMQYFEKIAARDNVPYTKPDPSGFDFLRDLTIPKSQYVMIGDSENDEEASHNAGIDFIHVNTL